jgi:hypothetical protein
LRDYFRDGRVYVWRESLAVVKSRRPLRGAFAVIRDKNEITVVIDQSKLDSRDVVEIDKDWKILTFGMVLPFGLVGFLARVSRALADEKVSILAISAFSTDHILVKESDLPRAIKKLQSLGFVVEER